MINMAKPASRAVPVVVAWPPRTCLLSSSVEVASEVVLAACLEAAA